MKEMADILWSVRTRDEFAKWAEEGAVVVVPIAATEQHGLHLPLDTDCRTVEYVSRRAARLLDDVGVLVTPTIGYGVSPHHMVFGGTLSLRVETVIALLTDICESITTHGFERILILSGHGGNGDTIRATALQLKHRLSRQIQAFSWFDLIPDTLDQVREGVCRTIGHSGEAETSAILALAPEFVRCHKYALVDGISDDPALGSAAKGESVLNAGAEALAQHLRSMAALPGRQVVGIERAK